mmetsp:Transcript_42/g.46  ORF Transcript_42/g.46 Transcript_42/m.46 type:complete len:199 (+) Transcript_42:1-597(+)|eukprot:CAMPEP_0170542054 /NCGR_PEP_ID=MMETSP0211-20121228/1602_1 /TAXON_ID=311385 /ORGANISM="Pseudokeronopsis sp., Strain OXSARD2" /LENGTH=198 /DNA_ID=CAMNT_0010844997 /DNA_START=1 /DNA_END=597 /DNA_ORIENTATION=+
MEFNYKLEPGQKKYIWLDQNYNKSVLLKNCNPELVLFGIEEEKTLPNESDYVTTPKFELMNIAVDSLQVNDDIFHPTEGHLVLDKIVTSEEGEEAVYVCLDKETQTKKHELKAAQLDQSKVYTERQVEVEAKIHTSLQSYQIKTTLKASERISTFVKELALPLNENFSVYSRGMKVDTSLSFEKFGIVDRVQKFLLIP